jgi:hypothetical protein
MKILAMKKYAAILFPMLEVKFPTKLLIVFSCEGSPLLVAGAWL